MTESEHEAGTAFQVGPDAEFAFLAWCPCGWRGPVTYITEEVAQNAADKHVADNGLEDCHACGGSGEITYNPSRSFPADPQMELTEECAACHGDGTQIRADLELLARAMSLPSERADEKEAA